MKIYYEPTVFEYELGRYLKNKYEDKEWIEIENHNNIPLMRNRPNSDFADMKNDLIIGVRKTHKYVENHKTSDYLVPFTSSGCSASCLYCYLVCNYNKCSYLRIFVNREQMIEKLIKTANLRPSTFEIGSNSDLILENTYTNNLPWVIESFAERANGVITFPTKFCMVEPILECRHRGKTVVRMSVNPQSIISTIELGTSPLVKRIEAVNMLCESGYKIGLLIAPVIMVENWKQLYCELLDTLVEKLSKKAKKEMFIEVIFMTYSFVHRKINEEAYPKAPNLYDRELMTGRGMGKYCYKNELRSDGEEFIRKEIAKRFKNTKIAYVV